MAFLYRNKNNGKLYTLTHLIKDIYHLNRNGFSGIYAHPYQWKGEVITHVKEREEDFNPEKFVEDNFEKVCEL